MNRNEDYINLAGLQSAIETTVIESLKANPSFKYMCNTFSTSDNTLACDKCVAKITLLCEMKPQLPIDILIPILQLWSTTITKFNTNTYCDRDKQLYNKLINALTKDILSIIDVYLKLSNPVNALDILEEYKRCLTLNILK